MFDPNQQSVHYPLAGNSSETGSTPRPASDTSPCGGVTESENAGNQPNPVTGIEDSHQSTQSGVGQPRILPVSQQPTINPVSQSPAARTNESPATSEQSAQVISIQPHLRPTSEPTPIVPTSSPATSTGNLSQPTPGPAQSHDSNDDGGEPSILKIDSQPASEATQSADLPTQPTPETPAIKVVATLLKTSHLLRAFLADHFAEFGLSDIRYTVMRRIDQSGEQGCSQAELARELNQSESSISTLIDRMRNDGLIYRLRSQNDRRKRVLLLSDEGRQRFARARACHGEKMGQLLSGLNEEQVATLQTSLDVLTDELAETKQTETVRAAA